MPYLPPADLPPPPIVETMPMLASTVDRAAPQLVSDQPERSLHQSAYAYPAAVTPVQTPTPELIANRTQFSSEPIPVDARHIPPLAPAATQAEYLQTELPPTTSATSTSSAFLEPSHQARPQAVFSTLSAPWTGPLPERRSGDATNPRETPWRDGGAGAVVEETANSELIAADENRAIAQTESDADPDTETETETETDTDTDDDEPVYPRAATPEANWANGAVVNGVLLPPTQPTSPPMPLNLTADYQEFEPQSQVLTARGDVVLQLGNGLLRANRLWANLANRFLIVEGDVIFTRGEQTVEADRGEYNLIQGSGSLFDARGTLFIPQTGTDFGNLSGPEAAGPSAFETDPISQVRSTGGITFGTGLTVPETAGGLPQPTAGGFVRRFRFEATRLDFDSEGWYAEDIGLTNDPFSPPELEFRGDRATLTRLTEFQDELYVENAQIVFDQGLRLPLLRDRILLNRGGPDSANPLLANVGFDGEDRDGLFVERSFRVFDSDNWTFFLTPQVLVQRSIFGEETPPPEESFLSNFGLEADLTGQLGPRTGVRANASFSGLDLANDNVDERLRASVRLQRLVGDHRLNLEYSYRDRLFNGSLGFQNVQSSVGLVLESPNITLGNTGIVVNYQGSAQYINANTDRLDLLGDNPTPPFRTSLGRFQGSVGVSRTFLLWQGEALAATPDAGLRFTPVPRVPNVQLLLSGRGTYTYYTSDDTQDDLAASVGIRGELGHFSRDFLDSTVFNLSYVRSFTNDAATSPFLFDRNVDQTRLNGGIIQQIYGPFRLGFQTSINLDTGEVINTDYILEYSRRTYSFLLRYNPTQSAGFFGFRLNEFDWAGRAARFGGADIDQVEGGVVR
ncbi:MAG: DUF3769 domain-containing protein [Cyanobacteria bacterium P01_C01_bin.120]